jgi:hypothetical protein
MLVAEKCTNPKGIFQMRIGAALKGAFCLLHCSVMSDMVERRWNAPPWWGLALAIASVLCNPVLFLSPPGRAVLPWLSIVLAVLALVFVGTGLKQIFGAANSGSRKVWGSILVVICLFLIGISALVSFKSRCIPSSSEAPQVGQKAPEFTLMDTHDQPVSLAELFSSTANDPPPKAVLLVFYRGYW